jgi:hypothetical protein
MYPQPWQRWAWAALPAVSATALTFVPFIIAWRRRVVGRPTLAAYLLVSSLVITAAAADLDFRAWGETWREVFRYTLWAYLIVGVVHVALLDWPRRKPAGSKA